MYEHLLSAIWYITEVIWYTLTPHYTSISLALLAISIMVLGSYQVLGTPKDTQSDYKLSCFKKEKQIIATVGAVISFLHTFLVILLWWGSILAFIYFTGVSIAKLLKKYLDRREKKAEDADLKNTVLAPARVISK